VGNHANDLVSPHVLGSIKRALLLAGIIVEL
jgi:hypothetical protein